MVNFGVFPVKYLNLLVQADYVGPASFAVKRVCEDDFKPLEKPKNKCWSFNRILWMAQWLRGLCIRLWIE